MRVELSLDVLGWTHDHDALIVAECLAEVALRIRTGDYIADKHCNVSHRGNLTGTFKGHKGVGRMKPVMSFERRCTYQVTNVCNMTICEDGQMRRAKETARQMRPHEKMKLWLVDPYGDRIRFVEWLYPETKED